MQRDKIIRICESAVLDVATSLYGTHSDALKKFPEYEGAANIVYEYDIDNIPLIMRITFSAERSYEQILAELHFINFLLEHGVKVSRPIPSQLGNLVETIQGEGIPFHVVTFIKGKGMRLPGNGYQYRNDTPIEEYYRNWGRTLGQMHALTKTYRPESDRNKRPEWFDLHRSRLALTAHLPDRLQNVQTQIQILTNELRSLPRDRDSFGLIHGDFNDGNFTVDYSNGDITVFDFDDACYFWFMYEMASAWEGGLGRTMFRGLRERQEFMVHYMDQVMEGYNDQNSLTDEWMERLPLFIRLLQVEELLHYIQEVDESYSELPGELNYKIKCIEHEIPYMGFFDAIYSPEKPFSL